MQTKEIARRFESHEHDVETSHKSEQARESFLNFVFDLDEQFGGGVLATSRELSIMWTAIEEASFWAQAHIARN